MFLGMYYTTNVGSGVSNMSMGSPNGPTTQHQVVMPYSGTIRGICAKELNNVSVSSGSLSFTASINGTANNSIKMIIASGSCSGFGTGSLNVVPGDKLGIRFGSNSGSTPTTLDFYAYLVVDLSKSW